MSDQGEPVNGGDRGGAEPRGPEKNVRRVALEILFEVDRRIGVFAAQRVSSASREARLNKRDRRFLTELVFGVLRNRLTLDCVIAAFSKMPLDEIGPRALEALRLGVYQLLYLDGVPAFAALHETVAAVKDARARPFVNGVLRTIDREVRRVGLEKDRGGASPRKRLAIGEHKVCFFSREIFADPEEDAALWLAQVHSHPPELVRRWLARFGRERTEAILARNQRPAPLFVRVNRLRTTREALLEKLRGEEIQCTEGSLPESVRVLAPPTELIASESFQSGLCTVQDETAMRVAPALGARKGELILDLCAAPGGKTTHLAELTNDEATILAVDKDESRIQMLRESVERLGLKSIACIVADATQPDAIKGVAPAPFDRVLVDAPCSNSGVLARRPEARWRIDPEHLQELVSLQRELLERGIERLFPGGTLVYSTCSIEAEENAEQIARILAAHPELTLVAQVESLTTEGGGDGGYFAVLRRAPQVSHR